MDGLSGLILFSLGLSFAYSLLWAFAIWRSRGSVPKWTLEVDFNHYHEGAIELVVFTAVPVVTLAAVALFLALYAR